MVNALWDLQGPFCRRFEPHHLTEGLKVGDHRVVDGLAMHNWAVESFLEMSNLKQKSFTKGSHNFGWSKKIMLASMFSSHK
ncbi:hypothetical protein PoB_006942400 [Plakobranchus ocellatus]|uniref:Uncharacterized protein n=1 Tax=Plakobranchus ocellatus TaxID=259542 RepID=A0AAV4DFD1_9GAST|nr:hypothetical protein PoB_006942400 [Plakobranchus ocellatus]